MSNVLDAVTAVEHFLHHERWMPATKLSMDNPPGFAVEFGKEAFATIAS